MPDMEKQGPGRIRIYLADIRPLYEEENRKRLYARLGAERRQKADACRTAEAKAASLAAGFLAAYGLECWGCKGASVRYEPGGRPVVEGLERELYLSLSHSGDYAVCALSDGPVGVDIQKKQPVKTGVLRHFFAKQEREAFLCAYGIGAEAAVLPEPAQTAFLRLWAAKESYMKLTGCGMGLGFERIWIDEKKRRIGCREGDYPTAALLEYPAPEGYVLAACRRERQ